MKTFGMTLCAVAMAGTASIAQAGFPTSVQSNRAYYSHNTAASACADGNCATGHCTTGECGQVGCVDGSCNINVPHTHYGTANRPVTAIPRSAGPYTPTARTHYTGYQPATYQPTAYRPASNCPGGICPTPRTNVSPAAYRGTVPSAACPNGNCPPTTYVPQQRYQAAGFNLFGLRF